MAIKCSDCGHCHTSLLPKSSSSGDPNFGATKLSFKTIWSQQVNDKSTWLLWVWTIEYNYIWLGVVVQRKHIDFVVFVVTVEQRMYCILKWVFVVILMDGWSFTVKCSHIYFIVVTMMGAVENTVRNVSVRRLTNSSDYCEIWYKITRNKNT